MKNVMISIKPKWCELIASGKKTIVFRKTRPKDTPFKCYIYCTKSKPLIGNYKGHIYFMDEENFDYYNKNTISKCNGKVIGEFICDGIISHCEMANADIAEQQGEIKREDLLKYANGKELYGWHISDLKIYDEPKELKRFGRFECEYCGSKNGFGGIRMTCKDCVHYDVCNRILNRLEVCNQFKNKTRFVELPCKVGDKIYKIWGCGKSGKSISEFIVSHIDIDYYPEIEISFTKEHSKTGYYYFAKLCDIGKTVFLTREEAERKLKENKNA